MRTRKRNSPFAGLALAAALLAGAMPLFAAPSAPSISTAPAPGRPLAIPPRPMPSMMPVKSTAAAAQMQALIKSTAPAAGRPVVAKSSASAEDEAAASALFATPLSINDVYNGTGLRDPFVSLLGASTLEPPGDTSTPPNIHNLALRGVITGGRERLALIEDTSTGLRYVLKGDGRLYNTKDKAIAGIQGSIKSSSSVLITTVADKDVQWLRLGESTSN